MTKIISKEVDGPKKKIRIFGVTVFSKKTDPVRTKYYLFGFRIFKKYNFGRIFDSYQQDKNGYRRDKDNFTRNINELRLDNAFLNLSLVQSLKNPVYHISFLAISNVGDNLLFHALQKSLKDSINSINFINRFGKNRLSELDVHLFNQSKGIIIGGGGVFLKDTNPNDRSGWQFPITAEQINQIEAPIFMLAVGYNRFRGQDDFDPVFKESMNTLVRKCKFVGIRNSGSIRALKAYLDDDLKDKINLHPCATTILSKIYDIPKVDIEEPFIAINGAFDRSEMRFGGKEKQVMESVVRVLSKLSGDYKIKCYLHSREELKLTEYLDAHELKYETVILYTPDMVPDKVIKIYSAPQMVMGMRGHGLMIPFGCNTPILSITNHEKQTWFMEDTGHPEWGVDVLEPNFEDKLLDTANYILGHRDEVKKEISKAQDRFYDITVRNLKLIAGYMGL